ncbi:MAG: GAF domain-containing protein, partial [Planctomycetes bacterium]|nr:GAF domain-containing protein [Planctomycetota bacterium]
MALETPDIAKRSESAFHHPPGEAVDGVPKSFSRKRLEDELRKSEARLLRQNAVLQGVNQVFEKALACESEEAVAAVCLSVAEALTVSKFGFIGELNAQGRFDTIALSDPGWSACRIGESHAVAMIRDMAVRGIWGQVLKDGKSSIVNEPSSHPSRVGVPEGHTPIGCFLGIPLKKEGNATGMIGLANKEGGYDRADQEAVEALSSAFVEALERKRAEESLRQSEQRYRQLLAAVTSYTYSVELDDGVAVSAKHSPGCLSATGYGPGEFAQAPELWIFMVYPEDRELVRRHALKVMAGEDVPPIEHRIFHKNETVRWVRDTVVQHYNDRGQLVRYDGLVEDITARKQAEEELRESEEKYRSMMESMKAAVYICSPDFRVEYMNPAMIKRTGRDATGEVCHKAIQNLDERCPGCI